jgi:hypothetical protein
MLINTIYVFVTIISVEGTSHLRGGTQILGLELLSMRAHVVNRNFLSKINSYDGKVISYNASFRRLRCLSFTCSSNLSQFYNIQLT